MNRKRPILPLAFASGVGPGFSPDISEQAKKRAKQAAEKHLFLKLRPSVWGGFRRFLSIGRARWVFLFASGGRFGGCQRHYGPAWPRVESESASSYASGCR